MTPAFLLPRPTSTRQLGVLGMSASVNVQSEGASLRQDGQLGTRLSSQAVFTGCFHRLSSPAVFTGCHSGARSAWGESEP